MRSIIKAYLIKLIAAFLILVFMMPQSIAAAEGLKLSASGGKGDIGDQVIIIIKAENAAGSEGGQFLLTYNRELIKPVSVVVGDLIAGADSVMHMANLEYGPGQIMYMWVTVYADTADTGVVCKIVFDLLKNGEALIKLSEIVVAPDTLAVAAALPGKIIIGDGSAGPGDSETADPDQDAGQPEENNNEDSDDEIDEDSEKNDEPITGSGSDDNSFFYVIGFVALVFLLTIGFALFKRLRRPDAKGIKR